MAREVSTSEMKKYFQEAIAFMETLVEYHAGMSNQFIEEDIKRIKKSVASEEGQFMYSFNEKDESTLKEILRRSLDKRLSITTAKADLLMVQSFVERLNLKLDLEVADFEKSKIDPFLLLEIFKKSERKFLTKSRNDLIKKTIGELESEGKEVSAESINDISGVDIKEIEKYLKRLDSVNRAREKNSKVK